MQKLNVAVAAGLLILFVAQGLVFIDANSQTSDEAVHLTAGYSYLVTGDFRLNQEHPPFLKVLSALPVYLRYRIPFEPDPELWAAAGRDPFSDAQWLLGTSFLYRSPVSTERILATGRIPNLLLGTLLVGLTGWWSYRLWGERAALVATALAAFEPNLIAHSSLITNDLGATLFIFLAVYLLWEYVGRPSWALLVAVGIATGMALVSKFSGTLLIGILGLTVASHVAAGGSVPLPSGTRGRVVARLPVRIAEAALSLSIIVAVSGLIIPVFYFFQGFSTWWSGINLVMLHRQSGHPAFFLGEYSSEGWWNYFIVAFLIKTPIGSLLLIGGSLLLYGFGRRLRRREGLFLLVPVVLVFAVTTYGRINIGLRHVLPVFPFLFVAASRLATFQLGSGVMGRLLVAVPIGLAAASSLAVAPHQLAYFNEFVGGPGEGYRYLSDSNIDWGQDLKGVRAYMREHRIPMIYFSYFGNAPFQAYGFPYQYLPGFGGSKDPPLYHMPLSISREVLAISVLNLHGIFFSDRAVYRWLLERKPVAKIGYSIYVYDLSGDADAHVRLAEVYLKFGPGDFALPELNKALALDPLNRQAAQLLSSLPP